MADNGFKNMTPEQYQAYIRSQKEKDYLLVDVRQPREYEETHIPGATLLPLSELESRLFELPDDKELVFYCRSGNRSQMAAMLPGEAEVTEKAIYNLNGGIMAWSGKTLRDFPKVKLFESAENFEDLIFIAMDMERGAERFYQHIRDRFSDYPFAQTFDDLSKAETGHARLVYNAYKKSATAAPEPFDTVYSNLKGEIMEGGETLAQMTSRLESIESDICLSLMEIALNIEYAAYDLYRTAANEKGTGAEAADTFLKIAQVEKSHMRIIARALADC